MRKLHIVLVVTALLLGGCDAVTGYLEENLVPLTPSPAASSTAIPTPTPTPTVGVTDTPVPTPTPFPTPTPDNREEYLEEGEWVVVCTASPGCKVRTEPTFVDDPSIYRTVLQSVELTAVARYVCRGFDQCDPDVPLWYYTDTGEWVSGLVWEEK